MAGCAGVFCNCMNLGVASIIDIGFSGGPSNNYPSWLDGLPEKSDEIALKKYRCNTRDTLIAEVV